METMMPIKSPIEILKDGSKRDAFMNPDPQRAFRAQPCEACPYKRENVHKFCNLMDLSFGKDVLLNELVTGCGQGCHQEFTGPNPTGKNLRCAGWRDMKENEVSPNSHPEIFNNIQEVLDIHATGNYKRT
jgi:hypothetical protein